SEPRSLHAIARMRARAMPEQIAFRFLPTGTNESSIAWTYQQVWEYASAVAHQLMDTVQPGDRVVLALRPGLPYVAALLGILQSGVTAVPAFPPLNRRTAERLRSIIADCAPAVVLVDLSPAEHFGGSDSGQPGPFASVRWMRVDT